MMKGFGTQIPPSCELMYVSTRLISSWASGPASASQSVGFVILPSRIGRESGFTNTRCCDQMERAQKYAIALFSLRSSLDKTLASVRTDRLLVLGDDVVPVLGRAL